MFGNTTLSAISATINICFIYCYGASLSSPPASDLEMQYLCSPISAVKSLKPMVLADGLGKNMRVSA